MDDRLVIRNSQLESVSSPSSSGEMAEENQGLLARLSQWWQVATQGTVISSIFILLTTCVGAGTLSLPYGFAQGGLVFSSVVFFVIMVSQVMDDYVRSHLTVFDLNSLLHSYRE